MNVLSLTTVPGRIHQLRDVFKSINQQTIIPDKVILGIPSSYKHFKGETEIEQIRKDLDYPAKPDNDKSVFIN